MANTEGTTATSFTQHQHESKSTSGWTQETDTTSKNRSTSISISPTTTMMSSSLQVTHGFSSDNWYKKLDDTTDELSSRVASSFTLSPSSTGNRSRSNSIASAALDTLALLASSAHQQLSASSLTSNTNASTSTLDDSQIMPPPPPRFKGRARSASNPEGMEKWDSYSYFRNHNNNRRHFILPTTILEEELAEVNETCKQKQIIEDDRNYESYFSNSHLVPLAKRGMTVFSIQGSSSSEHQSQNLNQLKGGDSNLDQVHGTSPTSVISVNDHCPNTTTNSTSSLLKTTLNTNKSLSDSTSLSLVGRKNNTTRKKKKSSSPSVLDSKDNVKELYSSNHTIDSVILQSNDEDEQQVEHESLLEAEELLRRARNRLLEDLNCSDNCGTEKGVLPLPHSLEKYKEVSIFLIIFCA